MFVSDLIHDLQDFILEHGDVEVDTTYFCTDCDEYHPGKGLKLRLFEDKLDISPLRLGED